MTGLYRVQIENKEYSLSLNSAHTIAQIINDIKESIATIDASLFTIISSWNSPFLSIQSNHFFFQLELLQSDLLKDVIEDLDEEILTLLCNSLSKEFDNVNNVLLDNQLPNKYSPNPQSSNNDNNNEPTSSLTLHEKQKEENEKKDQILPDTIFYDSYIGAAYLDSQYYAQLTAGGLFIRYLVLLSYLVFKINNVISPTLKDKIIKYGSTLGIPRDSSLMAINRSTNLNISEFIQLRYTTPWLDTPDHVLITIFHTALHCWDSLDNRIKNSAINIGINSGLTKDIICYIINIVEHEKVLMNAFRKKF